MASSRNVGGSWLAPCSGSRAAETASPALRVPSGPLRLRARAWVGARGCNLAVWRADLDRVDGFDASFSGWGREDSDLMIRLLRAGVRRKDGRYATGILHLWHPEADRLAPSENEQRLADVIASRRVRADRGISGLDAPAATGQVLRDNSVRPSASLRIEAG